ncbi:hypothetical protein FOL46_004327 [Perkinsus olseni]|uniref:Uncharacterized protein n=1 Tax=Perkinsus olseni TaxID=32597 RepID=A0A7J6LYG6_PEROL|nr:hypothetical protein FOL46_004327 [Perkinsus olseni]
MYTINCGSAVAQLMIIPFVVVLFFRAALEKERLVEEEKARRAIVSQHRSNTVLSSVQFGVDALVIPEEIDEDLLSDNESEDSAEIRRRQQFERRRSAIEPLAADVRSRFAQSTHSDQNQAIRFTRSATPTQE